MTRLAIIFSLMFATPAWAETVLYCQDEIANGIVKENGVWRTADFTLERYTVKFDEKKMLLSVGNFELECGRSIEKIIICNDTLGHYFRFHPEYLRYTFFQIGLVSYPLDSWKFQNFLKSWETTSMSHGTCQKF